MANVEITHIETTTAAIAADKRASCLVYDTDKDTVEYIMANASTLRHILTLDDSNNTLYDLGNIGILDGSFVGLGAGKGRIEFHDETTDILLMDDCDVVLGQGAARSIYVQEESAGIDGRDLTIQAGDGGTGGADTDGGDLYLSAGDESGETGSGGTIYLSAGSGIECQAQFTVGNIKADSASGLFIKEDGGTTAITIEDSTAFIAVGAGFQDPAYPFHVKHADRDIAWIESTYNSTAQAAPFFTLYRNDTGADDDELGIIVFRGKSDAGTQNNYAYLRAYIDKAASDVAGLLTMEVAISSGGTLQISQVNEDGHFAMNGKVLGTYEGGTTPTSTTGGSLWVDSGAGTNGTLKCYANGAWRTVAAL